MGRTHLCILPNPRLKRQSTRLVIRILFVLKNSLAPAAGEELDLDIEDPASDAKEPTEQQKRELFKMHRALDHPRPTELSRALKRAGVHRHLIRWAAKDLRCPVC